MKKILILPIALLSLTSQTFATCQLYLTEGFISSLQDTKDKFPPKERKRLLIDESKLPYSRVFNSLEPNEFITWKNFPKSNYEYKYEITISKKKEIQFLKTLNGDVVINTKSNDHLNLTTTDYEDGEMPGKRNLNIYIDCNL